MGMDASGRTPKTPALTSLQPGLGAPTQDHHSNRWDTTIFLVRLIVLSSAHAGPIDSRRCLRAHAASSDVIDS